MEETYYRIKNPVSIEIVDPNDQDFALMTEELSEILENITGSSGRQSFSIQDICIPRSLCVVARDQGGNPVGCGAIHPMTTNVAQLKRMYARENEIGLGTKILIFLENEARNLGYQFIRLETRVVNHRAVEFYKANGYYKITNFGKYKDRADAICFEKKL